MTRRTILGTCAVLAAAVAATGYWWHPLLAASGPGERAGGDDRYAYASPAFTLFVADSFKDGGSGSADDFYHWFAEAYEHSTKRYLGHPDLGLEELLDQKRADLAAITDPARRTAAEQEFCYWLHGMVKAVIPRFSLDRGFEFRHTVKYGERQCFLQSVLVSGMLQRAGIDSGVAMVSRNIAGTDTNNGHAVSVARLSDGTHTLVDCSDPEPFVRHQGLYLRADGYRYVFPNYKGGSGLITGYRLAANDKPIPASRIRFLDNDFLRSQFFFYRGERVPEGLLSTKPTEKGLEDSAEYLRTSVKYCPENPLAVFSLARVYVKQGKTAEAKRVMQDASRAYTQAGWLPPGPKSLLAQLGTK